MKRTGLDNRYRDKKSGEIRKKRGDTLNKNLPRPIPGFSPETTLETMRKKTGKTSEQAVRGASTSSSH